MDNFKYSLKTNQFNKKRHHIFQKQTEKQSISLQVHEPNHSVTHLIDFNKTQDIYGLSSERAVQYNKQQFFPEQQQTKVKFTKSSSRKISQNSQAGKNKNHQIKVTNKIKLSENSHETTIDKNLQAQITRQQLQALKYVLYNNQQRLKNLVDSINSLYRNTIELYAKHQRKLRQLVNSRCFQIAKIYRTALYTIKQKQKDIDQLNYKINMFVNTLKDSKQVLRLTKIKQQCIEALQKQQQKIILQKQQKKNKQSQKKTIPQNICVQQHNITKSNLKIKIKQEIKLLQAQNRKINSAKQLAMSEKYINKQPRRQYYVLKTSAQEQSIMISNENQVDISSIQSMIPPTPKSTIDLFEKNKSPFQANQLLLISNSMPVNNMNIQFKQNTQEEYSFRKSLSNGYREHNMSNFKNNYICNSAHYNNHNPFCSKKRTNQKKGAQTSQSYQILKNILQDLLKTFHNSNQIWLDNLNCLRRKNGTYVLDFEGNALICTQKDYQKLINEKIIVQPGSL